MVFAANAATVVDGRVLLARFRHAQRRPEERWYRAWFEEHGLTELRQAREINEGEGDLLLAGDRLLAGWGFRTSLEAHAEAASWFDREVVSLRLVDPAYYHLDTALAVVGRTVAWYPPAFSPDSQAWVRAAYPDAIEAEPAEAAVLGLNLWCDGTRAVMPAGAPRLAEALAARGLRTVEIDLSELRKAGGSVKCCTLELRS
jgi:N-dimethylarginine dimethylaminohydrolase